MNVIIYLPCIVLTVCPMLVTPKVCTDVTCEYKFVIRKARTMTYFKPDARFGSVAYNVAMDGYKLKIAPNSLRLNGSDPLIGTTVPADQVITGDGYERNVALVNEQFPGPTIEAMEGAQIVVEVTNHLQYEGVSIHWHGLPVRHTPWMDGVSYISQCPIHPRQKFTYRFKAEPAGTHWYHAHFRSMKTDGVFGLIKIHKAVPAIPSFPLMVADWFHYDADTLEILNPFAIHYRGTGEMHLTVPARDHSIDGVQTGAIAYDQFSIIVNGRGRYLSSKLTPHERFHVTPGQLYKFHLVNVGTEYHLEVSIDKHYLTVVSSDGFDINPVKVTSIVIAHGETIDFTIDPNQGNGLYWMRIRTLKAGKGLNVIPDNDIGPEGYAVVHYLGSNLTEYQEPTSSPRICTNSQPCAVFNCPFRGYPTSHSKTCVGFGDVTSTLSKAKLDQHFGVSDTQYEEVFLAFNFAVGSGVNGRKFINPTAPLYQGLTGNIKVCDPVECQTGCFCTNMLTLPYNKTIQMIISNVEPGQTVYSHHPIHLHGHSFAVLKVGYPTYNQTTGLWSEMNQDLYCKDKYCAPATWRNGLPQDLNTLNPPVKDTLIIPARGYAVVRIRTDNPGFWFMHCHTEQHIMDGMGIVLHEAADHIPPPPQGFPLCKDFQFSESNYQKYQRGDYSKESDDTEVKKCKNDNEEPTSSPGTDNNVQNQQISKENEVSVSLGNAVGACIGFILLGVVLTLLPLCLYHQCVAKKWMKYQRNTDTPKSHINNAFD